LLYQITGLPRAICPADACGPRSTRIERNLVRAEMPGGGLCGSGLFDPKQRAIVSPVSYLTLIRRLLALVAIAGLVLAPMSWSAGAMSMNMPSAMGSSADSGMAMPSDMDCCPKKAHLTDCGKNCPFMAICMGVGLQGERDTSFSIPLVPISTMVPGRQRDLDGLAQPPPTRPPKA
jgi:hypothetical protein